MEELKIIVAQMNDLMGKITIDNRKNIEDSNKAAGARARKNSVELTKLMAKFRKVSVEANRKK